MLARTLVRGTLLGIVVLVAVGYASAYAQREPCRDMVWSDVSARHVVARRLGTTGTPLGRDDIEVRIAGPFLVEVSYLVPEGLEGTLHVNRFLALPWDRRLRDTQSHRIPLLARLVATAPGSLA